MGFKGILLDLKLRRTESVGRVAPMEGTGNAYGIFAVNAKGNVR
jgi:hypothetical protein